MKTYHLTFYFSTHYFHIVNPPEHRRLVETANERWNNNNDDDDNRRSPASRRTHGNGKESKAVRHSAAGLQAPSLTPWAPAAARRRSGRVRVVSPLGHSNASAVLALVNERGGVAFVRWGPGAGGQRLLGGREARRFDRRVRVGLPFWLLLRSRGCKRENKV